MLSDLTQQAWSGVFLAIVIGGFLYAWIADAVLGRFGLGVTISLGPIIVAGFGSLYLMDWAVCNNYVPYGFNTPIVWSLVAVAVATAVLLVLTALKASFIR